MLKGRYLYRTARAQPQQYTSLINLTTTAVHITHQFNNRLRTNKLRQRESRVAQPSCPSPHGPAPPIVSCPPRPCPPPRVLLPPAQPPPKCPSPPGPAPLVSFPPQPSPPPPVSFSPSVQTLDLLIGVRHRHTHTQAHTHTQHTRNTATFPTPARPLQQLDCDWLTRPASLPDSLPAPYWCAAHLSSLLGATNERTMPSHSTTCTSTASARSWGRGGGQGRC